MNLKEIVRYLGLMFSFLRRKPKKNLVYSKDIVPKRGEDATPFKERQRGNNRKPTRGRNIVQAIDMGDGRFKFIKHKPQK